MNERNAARQVSLNDVLRLVLPLSTRVAGASPAGRKVSWVSVLTELEHYERQVQSGDIALLSMPLQQKADRRTIKEAIIRLAGLDVAALLTFQGLDGRSETAATDSGLPVLILSDDVSLREVHLGIAGLLVDRQKQVVERGMQLYRRLTEMSREGQGLAAMTEVMARLTGNIVAVQDKRLEIVALSLPDETPYDEAAVRAILGRPENLPRLLLDRKAAANTTQSHWQQLLSAGGHQVARLVSPIISGDRARGYVSVIGAPDELDMLDNLTAEHGAAACALEMAKAKAVSEAKKSLRGDFLEGLLAGRLPEKEINRLAGRLDHDTGRPHAIMALAWEGKNLPSLRRMETPLSMLLASHSRPALTHIHPLGHLCVFQALEAGDDDLQTARELMRRLREHLRAEFPQAHLVCGLSGPARSLDKWPAVYRQAVQGMELARRLGIDGPVEFERMGVYRLLVEMEDSKTLRRFRDQVIGPLVEYDREHKSSLVQTISAFFEHHGNVSQTAEELYIHRNTLLYRLERIQELTGQDLDDADMRLALQLALKSWQLRTS